MSDSNRSAEEPCILGYCNNKAIGGVDPYCAEHSFSARPSKEQLYKTALSFVVKKLGGLCPADFVKVETDKVVEAAYYAAENALLGHHIDGRTAVLAPETKQLQSNPRAQELFEALADLLNQWRNRGETTSLHEWHQRMQTSVSHADAVLNKPPLPSASSVEPPYLVRTFWSPDRRYLVTAHATKEGIVALQDDDGLEWEPSGPQQDMNTVKAAETDCDIQPNEECGSIGDAITRLSQKANGCPQCGDVSCPRAADLGRACTALQRPVLKTDDSWWTCQCGVENRIIKSCGHCQRPRPSVPRPARLCVAHGNVADNCPLCHGGPVEAQ